MTSLKTLTSNYFTTAFLLLAVASLSIEFLLYDNLFGSFEDGVPVLSGVFAWRSLFFLAASAALVFSFYLSAIQKTRDGKFRLPAERSWSLMQKLAAIALFSIALLSVCMLAIKPGKFYQLSREDVLIEPVSALLFFLASAFLLWQAWMLKDKSLRNKRFIAGSCCLLALIFFVIAMEEISWFQRVLEVETPDQFAANAQGELNFHNFATNSFERLYYSGAFLYLIALPFLQLLAVIPQRLKGLEVFTGNSFTLCLSSIFIAFNYDMWNASLTQLPFFLTLFMLLSLGLLSRERSMRNLFLAFAVSLVLMQVGFFLWGHQLINIAAATEYKEFFIAISFFISALSVAPKL